MMSKDTRMIKLSEDGEAIEFKRRSGFLYDISLKQIASGSDVIDWYFHLREKVEITPEELCEFMDAVAEACALHFGADPRQVFFSGGRVEWPI